ncbi:MAG: hypothetical protein Q4B54_01590 [Coriobacteriales bacterium]|nr:hypothetical protein [Coriobacteriales bacterium]
MTRWKGNGGSWRNDAPVFDTNLQYDWGGTQWPYPDVWITVQKEDPTANTTGRNCVGHYTPEHDPAGWQALNYGADYYDEGMACDPDTEHEKRILCFRAAELLYLHAASKGNTWGDLCLGYIYSYDRCEGSYWEKVIGWKTAEDLAAPYPHLKTAYEHYRIAAEADIAEACYKLGDLLRDGRGCEVDLAEAFDWFYRAYKWGKVENPVIWGSAALRLGQAFEEGEGCEQSFVEAKAWYERATTGLDIAVRNGEGWYRGALTRAERGLARVCQELSGAY